MRAMMLATTNDVFFIGRRVLGLLRDPRSDARRLARLINHVPRLSYAVLDRAEILLSGRGRVRSTAHAITLIGYDRLERTVRGFLRSEYSRLREAEERAEREAERAERVERAADKPVSVWVEPEMRYAAM